MKDIKVVIPNQYNYAISTSTNVPLAAEGLDNLIQIIVKAIKTTPGRDIFSADYGMGLKYLLPSVAATVSEEGAKMQVGKGLMTILGQIKDEQNTVNLDPEEKLENLELVDVTFDTAQALWEVTIKVTSAVGSAVVVGISV